MDSAKQNEIHQWLRKAHNDLRSSRQLLVADPPLLDTAAYHSQQCAEKALKAFLVLHDDPPSKTHLLVQLVARCQDFDPRFSELLEAAEFLTPFATAFRYPGDVLEPDLADTQLGICYADQILSMVTAAMPPEADS